MATDSNRLQSVVKLVNKPPVQPFNKPEGRQQPSSQTPQPSKVESLEDQLSHMNNEERLTFELDRFGYFTIEEGGRWTQAEIDTEFCVYMPQNSSKPQLSEVQHSSSIGISSQSRSPSIVEKPRK